MQWHVRIWGKGGWLLETPIHAHTAQEAVAFAKARYLSQEARTLVRQADTIAVQEWEQAEASGAAESEELGDE